MPTVEIPLTQGKVALIDEDDESLVRSHVWHACRRHQTFYAASMSLHGHGYYMHRLIMNAAPEQHVDHRNGDGLDNRRANLRLCTNAENRRNMRICRGRSRFKGVSLDPRQPGRPWVANIHAGGKRHALGAYPTEIEAARAYNAAAVQLHGEFASLNSIEGFCHEEAIAAPVRNRRPGRPCSRAIA